MRIACLGGGPAGLYFAISKRLGVSDEEARAILAKRNPVGRLISADEVTSGALYLASPGAAMINGHALSVSGGLV